MGIIVQKFGGTSVANTEKLLIVCNHIIEEYRKGKKIIVVVSAQGNITDKLQQEETEITPKPNAREHDMLLSVGEQITISKLAIYLNCLGYKAISYLGWQVPIITNENFGDANILNIGTEKINRKLDEGYIVIVAGFQGITKENEITTLGRGGSDTTAVALASAFNAHKLYIYTDVDGVYSDDPNKNTNAIRYDTVSYDKMICMANAGAKVLHAKCVELAKQNRIPIIVKSTFEENSVGTLVQ